MCTNRTCTRKDRCPSCAHEREHARIRRERGIFSGALERIHQQRARIDAREVRLYAELWRVCRDAADLYGADSDQALEHELRSVSLALGASTNISDRTVKARFARAYELVHWYPHAVVAMEDGLISLRHAQVIADEGNVINDPRLRERFTTMAIEIAKTTTPGRLAGKARTLAATLDKDAAKARIEAELAERHVSLRDLQNGMSEIVIYLPTVVAHAIYDRLTTTARSVRATNAFGQPVDAGTSHYPAVDRKCRDCIDGFVKVSPSAGAVLRDDDTESDIHPDVDWALCPSCSGVAAVETSRDPREFFRSAPVIFDDTTVQGRAVPKNGVPTDDLTGAPEVNPLVFDADGEDHRSFDAIRADTVADLLLAGLLPEDTRHAAINNIQGTVSITVPALALAGATNDLPSLNGVGPIDLETAMQLTSGATIWQRVLTDPLTGMPITADTYRPPVELKRFIETRDQHCRAPGCRQPAHRCDIDHTHAWHEGGQTTPDNLAALCRYHHTIKHRDWTLTQAGDPANPASRILTWTSPDGQVYRDEPNPLVPPMTPEQVQALMHTSMLSDAVRDGRCQFT